LRPRYLHPHPDVCGMYVVVVRKSISSGRGACHTICGAMAVRRTLTQLSHDVISALIGAVEALPDAAGREAALRQLGGAALHRLERWLETSPVAHFSLRAPGAVEDPEDPYAALGYYPFAESFPGQPRLAPAPFDVGLQPVTFHLVLSRALAIGLRRCCTASSVHADMGPAPFLSLDRLAAEELERRVLGWMEVSGRFHI
jgi:hypothetical protein